MKKYFLFFLFGITFFPIFFVGAEYIESLDVEIAINDDATLSITERIVYDFEQVKKHGIYRDIPIKYKTDSGNNRTIDATKIFVTDENDVRRTFAVSREGKNKRIKIGDADKYVTGKHVYVISYIAEGAINYFDTHDELYWNAVGGSWEVPIHASHVKVYAPQIDRITCFSGPYGSTAVCDEVIKHDDVVAEFVQKDIMPGSSMTTVIGMSAGAVYKPTFFEKFINFILDNWIVLSPIFVFIFMGRTWFVHGRDPEGRGTIVPYYEVPENLSPAEVGMIITDSVKKEYISALLINLAVKGYMHIRRTKKGTIFSSVDYIFIKTEKNIDELDAADEKQLYNELFSFADQGEVNMSQLKDKFYQKLEKIISDVRGRVVEKGYYVKNPNTVRKMYIIIGIMIFSGGLFVGGAFGFSVAFAVALSGIIIGIFGFYMPKRTKKGAIIREQILGLKLYMETAERDRINFHNAPEKEPRKFEELLPYAMVLGVEKEWAKQFEDIYDGQPDWYQGADSFHPALLASDMRGMSNMAATSMSSSPSSAGSGGSGFSGGGSGGGGGGGGGGSW